MRANLASGMDGGTVYPFSRVGSNPLWADAGPFFGPITESNAPFHLPVCPQRDTLTGLSQVGELFFGAGLYDELVSSQFFGESLAVAGLLTEPPWLGQETGHSHPGLLRGYLG